MAKKAEELTVWQGGKDLEVAVNATIDVQRRNTLRLGAACRRSYISTTEFETCDRIGDQLARMLTGLIKCLVKSDRTDRGL